MLFELFKLSCNFLKKGPSILIPVFEMRSNFIQLYVLLHLPLLPPLSHPLYLTNYYIIPYYPIPFFNINPYPLLSYFPIASFFLPHTLLRHPFLPGT